MNDADKANQAIKIAVATSIIYCLIFIYLMSEFAEQLIKILVAIVQIFAISLIIILSVRAAYYEQ